MTEETSGKLNTNFNQAPYWDDHNPEKNYVRILHKGGVGHQIREATQAFTIQQHQNKRITDHFFKNGSIIRGGEFNIDVGVSFLRLKNSDQFSNDVNINNFIGTEITGETSGLKAIVVDISDGDELSYPSTKTLFIKYLNNSVENSTFVNDENIIADNSFTAIAYSSNHTGSSALFTISKGTVWAKGFPVDFNIQKIILEKYNNTPSYKVGFEVKEIIVKAGETLTETTDPTLYDQANDSAPGADRLQLIPSLKKYDLDLKTTSPDFVELFTIKNGEIQTKNDRPQYSDIKNELALRTYNESGDYIVSGLNVIVSDHLDTGDNNGYKLVDDGGDINSFDISISPGVGVIKGYDFNILISNHLKSDKGIDYINLEQQIVSSNYGNYAIVNETCGFWDVTGGFVDLYDSPQLAVTSTNFSSISPSGTIIGKCRVRSIQYSSFGTNKLYLYDIKMTGGDFSSVKSIYLNNPSNSDGFADIIMENDKAVLKETGFTSSIIKIPNIGVKDLRNESGDVNNSFNFQKSFDVTIGSDGIFTVDTGNANQIFPFGVGVLNNTQSQNNFYLTTNESGGTLSKGEFIDLSVNGRTITSNSPTTISIDTKINIGTSVSATIICSVEQIDGKEILKTIHKNRYILIDTASHPNGTTGPWSLGISDIYKLHDIRVGSSLTTDTSGISKLNSFIFDDGQRDGLYDYGKIIRTSSSSLQSGDKILLKFDYFEHDVSQGSTYLSIDSYPIDDLDSNNQSAIMTHEIPIYKSPSTGDLYDLRNCIDCRPKRENVSLDSTIISTSTVNPDETNNEGLKFGVGGLKHITPNSKITTDLSYYLKRKDLVIMDKLGNFDIIRGVSSLNPVTPQTPNSTMSLSTINISPYPSLPMKYSINVGRADLATKTVRLGYRRYTMKNIGTLDQRISNLEYESSLNKLEKDTKDLKILDENGLDRFKNGIIVDNFTGHKVGDVVNPDYKISIDPRKRELRPSFNLDDVGIIYNSGTNIYRSPNDIFITVIDSTNYEENEIVYQGVNLSTYTAKGVIKNIHNNKILLEDISGIFSTEVDVIGVNSNTISNLSAIKVIKNGPLITLPYTHKKYSGQDYASNTRNAAGLFWSWKGNVEIFPKSDFWTDTTETTPVNINFDGNLDAWEQLADQAWATEFGDWTTRWTGTEVDREWVAPRTLATTTTVTTNQDRTVDSIDITSSTETQTIDNNVIDVSISPLMRPRPIFFKISGCKPDTTLFTFMDNVDLTSNVLPLTEDIFNNLDIQSLNSNFFPGNFDIAEVNSTINSDLTTDSNGNSFGIIFIPEGQFINGTKIIRFSDNIINSEVIGQFTTEGKTSFTSSGLNKTTQDTIISTQQVELTSLTSIESVTTVDTTEIFQSVDPIAQSFKINADSSSGIFLSKIDIYFQTKDTSLPVTIEIREMYNNQVITNKIIPYSKTILYPEDVNISSDGTIPTTFYFESPVFLQHGYDYAFVILPAGSNPNYNVWISELGGIDINTGDKINQQPNTGVMFASSNNGVWSPIQTEDIKYTLYKTSFNTSVTGNIKLENEKVEFFKVDSQSNKFSTFGEEIKGETSLTIENVQNGTFSIGEIITGDISATTGIITSVTPLVIKVKSLNEIFTDNESITSENNITADVNNITVPTGNLSLYDKKGNLYVTNSSGNWANNEEIFGTISGNTANIISIENKHINLINPQISNLLFANTTLNWKGKTTNSSNLTKTNWFDLNINVDNELSKEMILQGFTQENNNKSLEFSVDMKSNDENLSPVVDLSRAHSIIVGHIINDDDTEETDKSGGNALAKYITKKVQLAEGQDAEDFKLYLTAYRPSGTRIKPYIKLLHGEDSDIFEDRPWIELEGSPHNIFSDLSSENFTELEFSLPDSIMTGVNDNEVQYINSNGITLTGYKYFSIKIILLSPNTSLIPKCKEGLRGLCLQK